jgi:glycosyltransferase involved in cell wall biosynthesis
MKLSVIIPARNEFPNVVHTIYSIWHCWEADGFDPKEIEIIIVDNNSTDWELFDERKKGDKGTTSYLEGRGAYWNRALRILRDPIAGNHSARNKGARIAKGKYLFFSDAHMAYRPGFFKHMIETIDETGGLFHGVIGWMGAYPPTPSGLGYGYTLKLGEEWKGTWNNYCLDEKEWFHIISLGHCSVGVLKEQFLKFGGYPDVHRTYGGGELYMDIKWWMFGSTVSVHPQAIGYHLASGRGYTYDHDDYIENVLGCCYALGCDDWRERAYINWMRRGRKDVLDKIMQRNEREYAKDREFISRNKKFSFNELLLEKPWDKMNEKRLGKSNGHISIFHDTWLNLLKESPPYVQDAYKNSKYQKDLEKFINENLSQYVYKRAT